MKTPPSWPPVLVTRTVRPSRSAPKLVCTLVYGEAVAAAAAAAALETHATGADASTDIAERVRAVSEVCNRAAVGALTSRAASSS